MQTVSPNLFVTDLPSSIAFYQQLGFRLVTTVPDKNPIWAMMTNGTATFRSQTFSSIENQLPSIPRQLSGALLLYIKMEGIRGFYEKVKAPIPIEQELNTTFYGATEFSILDNNGFMLTFAEDE